MRHGIETMHVDVPVIETDRLILRAPRFTDLEAITAFGLSERSHFVGGPVPPWQSWSILTGMIGHWIIRGYGWWMIEDKATGQAAGRTGIGHNIDWPEPELGWHLYDGFEGKGIAYEAALAAREHAYGAMGLGPLISLIAHGNLRSRRLAERMGAAPESETVIRGTPCVVFRHPMGTA
ncbi:GNAT family N-acetyltransferase [Paracoccus sp. CPCC 101403]|uniref:GNAT family N-acetyltransferase n=1 Tax=Paracoccus broussonetiae TaxID=3075834 RepID=A0ABU3EBX8_9RHOB|nr:GNAT family N-acetyltransferase [Paracoccus sp. CPCC 101403]MDT1061709.1 GNAT family N-acetyltransferase [Paracoccus sp. CPCC 101403]